MTDHCVYLALGSNMGDRHGTLSEAIRLIGQAAGRVERVSPCRTTLTPREVLAATQEIERQLGRKSKSTDGQYHDRPIDIDILIYDDLHIDEPDLHIPHPLMHERDFVMKPLREIMD